MDICKKSDKLDFTELRDVPMDKFIYRYYIFIHGKNMCIYRHRNS